MLFQATPSPADNPRERLTSLGASALTSAELIAVLLGAGSPSRSAVSYTHLTLPTSDLV